MKSPAAAVYWLALRRQRWRTLGWSAFFVLLIGGVVASYKQAYPDPASRLELAGAIAQNTTFRAIYGEARNLETVGGFISWRIGAMSVFAGVWGLLTTTALLRGDEEEGRWEIQVSGRIGRGVATASIMAAVATSLTVIWALLVLSLVAQGLEWRATAFFAAAFMGPAVFFGALGALASQISATRRAAAGICGTVLGFAFLLKIAADGTRTLGWLRWFTPSGWYEEAHTFTGSSLLPLAVFAASGAVLSVAACMSAARRDLGASLIFRRTHRRQSRIPVGSVWHAAIRQSRGSLAAWVISVVAFSLVLGALSKDVLDLLQGQEGLQRLIGAFLTPELVINTYVGLMFVFIALPVALFAVLQLAPIREEEATGRLDLILTQPVGRRRWLAERLAVVLGGTLLVAMTSGVFVWTGARLQGVGLELGSLIVAAVNCVPPAILFLGIGVLAFGLLPRAASGIAIGTVLGTYVSYLVGSVAKWPSYALDLSPYFHVAPYPAAPMNTGASAVMTVAGLGLSVAGIELFARRDLAGE